MARTHPYRRLFFAVCLLALPVSLQATMPGADAPGADPARAGGPIIGQEALDAAVFPGLETRLSLDLRGMDVIEVLKFLATKGNLNVVTSPEVQGRATLVLSDVSVRDAMDIVLVSNGLAVERRGTILYILSEQVYETLYGRRYTDPRRSLTTQLTYANPGQVGALLATMKSPVGRIVIDEPTATIAIVEVPDVLQQMQDLILRVDLPTVERQLPTETRTIDLHFAKAEDVASQLDTALTPNIGQLRVDKRSNRLIITDLPARFPRLEHLVSAFDARHRQVFIESTIVQVTLADNFDAGINWEWLSKSDSGVRGLNVVHNFPIGSDVSNPAQFIVGTLKANDTTGTLKILQDFGDTEIISSPHIAVLNNEEAKILVGRREAFVTTTVTQAQTTATTAESIEFVDVGVKLFVTPTISENQFVTMKIRPEVSSVVTTLKTSSGNTIPIIETTEAETQVMVKDGVTLVIGGLMRDETILSTKKLPLLGDLPLVGWVFGNRSDRIKKTELVILLTPHIISGEEYFVPATTASVNWPAASQRAQ